MKTFILTQTKIKQKISKNFFVDNPNIIIVDFDKKITKNIETANLIVILTREILERNNIKYKKILSLIKKKDINVIEVAFEKSMIINEKAFSNAIIHGFGNMTLEILKKIEISFRGVN